MIRLRLQAAALAGAAAFVALAGDPPGAASVGPLAAVEADTAGDTPAPPAPQNDPAVLRMRRIAVDFDRLPDPRRRRLLALDRVVRLELFDDVVVNAVLSRFDPNPDGVTWVGHVEGAPASSVTLVYGGGLLAASIVLPGAAYQIRPAPMSAGTTRPFGPVIHVVSQIDQDALPPEAPPIEVAIDADEAARAAEQPLVDAGDTIDLMVVYTAAAAAHAGGPTSIVNLINLGVSETNTSYANSGINQRLELVHTAEVGHVETGSLGSSLTALRTGSSGMSSVPALRDLHRADLVMLLVHPTSPDACGVAFLLGSPSTAFAPFAVSVADTGCVSPNYTFAHELGHNMGARHDWFVDNGVTPFTYAHGYVNPTPGQRWRTIMAYPDLCSRQGFSCTRLLFWANPDNRFVPFCTGRGFSCGTGYWFLPGAAMGVREGTSTACAPGNFESYTCDADDRRALNNTAVTVANFRPR
jgi:hypothetical protein